MAFDIFAFFKKTKARNDSKKAINTDQKQAINPYLAAREEWLERYGDYIAQKHNWQIMAFLSIGVAFVCILFLGYMGTQNKLIPYIIEVDKLGKMRSVATANTLNLKNENVVKFTLSTFIINWRSVWADSKAQEKFVFEAYNYLKPTSPALLTVSQEFRENNPFAKAQEETSSVKIHSIFAQSPTTWQVEWNETRINKIGEPLGSTHYRGFFVIEQIIPTTEEQILKNPLGIFITNISYSKIL